MPFIQHLESRFGLTRGDVTVALFLAFAACGGAVYTELIEDNQTFRQRTELAALINRSDSVTAAREAYLAGAFASDSDSVARWDPLSEEEILEEGTSDSPDGRSAELTLEDVAPINLNTASAVVLQLLPGVGEKTAIKIIEGRPYRRIEDILRVKGIGEKKLAKMRAYITTGVPAAAKEELAKEPDEEELSEESVENDTTSRKN
ncbi:MAG: ComEA family DNA-binding protein [Candidatus Kapaibacterium sp.]